MFFRTDVSESSFHSTQAKQKYIYGKTGYNDGSLKFLRGETTGVKHARLRQTKLGAEMYDKTFYLHIPRSPVGSTEVENKMSKQHKHMENIVQSTKSGPDVSQSFFWCSFS